MDYEAYLQSCQSPFWQRVFQHEIAYLEQQLAGCRRVLSVGCGPAIIEAELARRGYELTGLDVSAQALSCAPDSVRTTAGRAEEMPFDAAVYDAVVFVVSLQFVDDYHAAIDEAWRVLRPAGRLIILLLNPQSAFFIAKSGDLNSYIQLIKHTDNEAILAAVERRFKTKTEYCLGIRETEIFKSSEPTEAALFCITGERMASG
ncbi:class I SAM-dependent methyltransferase [bacterium]|nr:class I SAM-dependent methyltransferase [bacterium]